MAWYCVLNVLYLYRYSYPGAEVEDETRQLQLAKETANQKRPHNEVLGEWYLDFSLRFSLRYMTLGKQFKIVRWCQIRRIWRVINQFKAIVMLSSYCNIQTCVQEHCPGETGLPLSVFQAVMKCL